MELNISKTEEMILGQYVVTNLPLLSILSQISPGEAKLAYERRQDRRASRRVIIVDKTDSK